MFLSIRVYPLWDLDFPAYYYFPFHSPALVNDRIKVVDSQKPGS
jgi:hypothetical protein